MDIEKYKEISQEVDARLADIVDEFTYAINALKNDSRVVRTRLLIAFSLLEVVCNLFNAFFNLGLGNRALLEKWLNDFCLNDMNRTFKAHPYLRMITPAHMYKFRNAIVHTLGLPEPENGISITVPNGTETAEIIKKMDEGFKSLGHKVAFISADELTKLFLDGYAMMHLAIFKNPATAVQSDLDGLVRILSEFNRRGARPVPLVKPQ